MSDNFQVRIDGLDVIIDRMALLSTAVQRRIARRAVRAGANQIARQARLNAKALDDPDTAEAIYKNITVRTAPRLGRRVGGVADRIGVIGGAQKYADTKENRRRGRVGMAFHTDGSKENKGGDTWYWRFIEFGSSLRTATPFMRPAVAQSANAAFNATADTMQRLINDEVAKL